MKQYHTGKSIFQLQKKPHTHICIAPQVAMGHISDRTLDIKFTTKQNVVYDLAILFFSVV